MKFLKFFTAIILFTAVLSCRNNDIPEDIHEHEEVNKITLTITENGTTNTQTVSFQAGTGATAPINLENGKLYSVNVGFFHHHNGVDEDITAEIIEEKDEHFIKYQFGGIQVEVLRTAEDIVRSDQEKIGLKTQWTVNSAPSNAVAIVQLFHGATTVNGSDNNGAGSTVGGEADVNAQFTVN